MRSEGLSAWPMRGWGDALAVGAVMLSACMLTACGRSSPADFPLTQEGVKSLDPKIISVSVIDQVDGVTKYVDLTMSEGVVWGGQSDWNAAAITSHRLIAPLMKKAEVSRVRVVFYDPENKIDWAQVKVARADLPPNWEELTYLQLFAAAKPMPGTLEVGRWLCDFYAKYSSANPTGAQHLQGCGG